LFKPDATILYSQAEQTFSTHLQACDKHYFTIAVVAYTCNIQIQRQKTAKIIYHT